ncbi:MAG: PDZ domain-containing protein [Nitrospiraceae bacterium]|nr:PDZ domain-containing protein [Nitrospiraceae bacterium]
MLVFVLVLGLLVFFHEMGHFLAAKACGIYVDRFSLGMPPRVFGKRLGETDYCIGLLPIGGYVKMAGQEDTPLSEEEREATYGHVDDSRWYNNKPVWQRAIVTVAGPLMNLALAILLYGIIAGVGAEVPLSEVDNRIGLIEPGSPASSAPLYPMPADGGAVDGTAEPAAVGWETGDRILSINGETVESIMDVAISAVLSTGEPMRVVIERTAPDGSKTRYLSLARPEEMAGGDHVRFGVSAFETALLGEIVPDSPAEAIGLQAEDVIVRADGRVVDMRSFRKIVENWPSGKPLAIEIDRDGEMLQFDVTPRIVGRFVDVILAPSAQVQIDDPELAMPVVLAAPAALTEDKTLLAGDVIERIDGQPATMALLDEIENTRAGQVVELQIRRPAVLRGLVRGEETRVASLELTAVGVVGVRFGTKMVFHRMAALQVVPEAFRLGYQALARTVRTVAMLVTGNLSVRDVGGPVMIYQITTAAAQAGYWWLFRMTAFISANLCVFNLLPLPVLDGGMLLYLGIEGVRGKPIDMRILERVQQVGLVMIVGLLLFVTYNDISRWISTQLQ